jgi:hypothetical protein
MARAARRRAPHANAADALEWLAYAAVGLRDEERHSQCPRPASPFRNNLVTILCAIERQSQGRIHVFKNDCKACRAVERGFFYSERDAPIGGERQVDRHFDPGYRAAQDDTLAVKLDHAHALVRSMVRLLKTQRESERVEPFATARPPQA